MGNTKGRNRYAPGEGTLYVTMAVAFILIALIAAMALFFKVTDITVEGAGRYSDSQVVAVSGLERDTSIFFISTSSAEVAIKSGLPYVDTVKVTRHLPGTVTIEITEAVSAAYAAQGGNYYVIDLSGRILEATPSRPRGVEIRGAVPVEPETGKTVSFGESESVRLRALTDVLKMADKYDRLELMSWIDITNLSAITFDYNGYRFNIGTADELELKFGTLIRDFLADNRDPGNGQGVYYDGNIKGLRW